MNKSDLIRNQYMLRGKLAKKGYDWWWHSFTGIHQKTGKKCAFYIEYFVINPALSPSKVILGQGDAESKPSYVMINSGAWGKNKKQLHEFYPVKDLEVSESKLDIKIGNCHLTENKLVGSCHVSDEDSNKPEFMCDKGSMSWNLKVDKQIAYNVGYGANRLFRRLNVFEMYWHAEGIKTEYEGQVTIDGECYDVIPETSYGYSDKNWGSDFTSPWLWISSCHLVSKISQQPLKYSAIELGGGRPKVFSFPIKEKILIGIFYEGEMIEFNFSKFWKKSSVSFSFQETETQAIWHVEASNRKYKIKLYLTCELEEMLEINYEAPNGIKRHNHLLNGGTGEGNLKIFNHLDDLIDDIDFYNTGCEYGEFD